MDTPYVTVSLAGYRTITRWTYVIVAVLFSAIGASTAAFTTHPHPGMTVAAVAAGALTCVSAAYWPSHPRFFLLQIATVIGVSGWGVAVWVGASPTVGLALFLPLAYAIATRRPWWPWALATLAMLVIAAIISATGRRGDTSQGLADQLTAVFFLGAEVIVFLAIELGWVFFSRMDAHRANENELAISSERLRFANDLHDLQGHTLIAIKLKTELARRTLDHDPEATRRELTDIETLIDEVAAQTRKIANDCRTVTLAAELANADALLTAAGVQTAIDPAPRSLGDAEPLIATMIREAVSNILRHADASLVSIRFTPETVTIVNDGVRADRTPEPGGSKGLASLRTRFTEQGGTLTWTCDERVFTLAARFPEERGDG